MVKEEQAPEGSGPEHEITPDMVQSVVSALESEGLIKYSEGGAYVPTQGGWKLLRDRVSEKETITAKGHPKINPKDEDNLEITRNDAPVGEDSVIAISADKACKDFSSKFKNAARSSSVMEIVIEAGGEKDIIKAHCSPALQLKDSNEIVVRKSDFIDGKTVAILADKSAKDLKSDLKKELKSGDSQIKITLEVK